MTERQAAAGTRVGVIFVNPRSGPHDTPLRELQRLFPGQTVEECEPQELAARVVEVLRQGADFIGVAGGDGTIRSAAEHLVGSGVPLLPIPAGTRNHFARDVGVEDLDAAAKAIGGQVITVDLGRVNGRCFVNNSSIGMYPKIVIRREVHRRRLRKGVANVVAGYEQLREGGRVKVEIDGASHQAWMVFVGNGTYGAGLLDLADRESLDGRTLDVRVARADRPFSRLRIVAALMLGRLARSPLVLTWRTSGTVVRLDRSEIEVALDGEVEVLETPLAYESVAGGLHVLVP